MTNEELIVYIVDKVFAPGISPIAGGSVLVLLSALLLKKYVINGNIKRFLDLLESAVNCFLSLDRKLSRVIREQRKLHETIAQDTNDNKSA